MLDDENIEAKDKVVWHIYNNTVDKIKKCKMMPNTKKLNTSRCMEKMRTTSSTKTKKMKIKMETKFLA